MALTTEQRRNAARRLAREMFEIVKKTANLNLDDLLAAVGAIDDAMDALPAVLNPVQTVKINLVQNLPEPFKSNSNASEKGLALMVWVLQETGRI